MDFRALIFPVRKDLLQDLRVLFLVLLAIGSGSLAIVPLNGLLGGFTKTISETTVDIAVGHVVVSPPKGEAYIKRVSRLQLEIEGLVVWSVYHPV